MNVKGYVITNASLVGAVFATSLDPQLKALALALIAVVSLIANLLWIGGKFREAVIKRLMADVKEEIYRLDYMKYESAEGKVASVDKVKK